MKPKGKRTLAWLLAFTVAFSSNSFTVFGSEFTDDEVQEAIQAEESVTEESTPADTGTEEQQETAQTDETPEETAEGALTEKFTDDVQLQEETEEVSEEEILSEDTEEVSMEEDADDSEETVIEEEEELFSAGDEGVEENGNEEPLIRFTNEDLLDGYLATVYTEENYTLTLDTSKLAEGQTVEWEIGYSHYVNEVPEFAELPSIFESQFWEVKNSQNDGKELLELNGAKLAEAYEWLSNTMGNDYWFEVNAKVSVENTKDPYVAFVGLRSMETRREVQGLPENAVLLVGDDVPVSSSYACFLQDSDHPFPDGGSGEAHIRNVTVKNSVDENTEENQEEQQQVCESEGSETTGWKITALNTGAAEVTYEYTVNDGETVYEDSFLIFVSEDRFNLDIQYPASGSEMLPESEITIPVHLYHDWYHQSEEGGDRDGEEVSEWKLELDPTEDGWSYDEDVVSVEIDEETHQLTVTSKALPDGREAMGTGIRLKASVYNEDEDKWDTVTYQEIGINVRNEYDVIYPEFLDEDPEVLGTLDLNSKDLEVKHYKAGSETTTREDITWRLEYDEEGWEKVETEETGKYGLPVLKRVTPDNTWVRVYAKCEKEDWEIDREFRFDHLDYSVRFENMRDGENSTYLFADESSYELTVDTENLADMKNAEFGWRFGYRNWEQENSNFEPLPDDFAETVGEFWESDEKSDNKLILDAGKLAKAYDWLWEKQDDAYGFEIQAVVSVGDKVYWEEPAGIQSVQYNEINYEIPDQDRALLPGETAWIDKEFNCWQRNTEYPWGGDTPITITKMMISDPDVCSLVKQSSGWLLKAKEEGTARVVLNYRDLKRKSRSASFEVQVTNDGIYWMELEYADDYQKLTEGENIVTPKVYFKDQDHPEGKVLEEDYEWEEEIDYDGGVFENIEWTEEGNLKITAGNPYGESNGHIHVRAFSSEKDSYGEPLWSTDGNFNVCVTDQTGRIVLNAVPQNVKTGEKLNMLDYKPTVVKYNNETGKWEEVPANEYELLQYHEENDWDVLAEVQVPTLIRKTSKRTNVRLVAYIPGEDRELASADYEFDSVYDSDVQCQHRYDTIESKEPTCTETGYHLVKCDYCGETAKAEIPATGHTMETKIDSQPGCGTTGKQHQECKICGAKQSLPDIPATGKHTWGSYQKTTAATVLKQGTETRKCTKCSATETRKTATLKATVEVQVSSLPLQKGKSVNVAVTGMTGDDYLKSVISSDPGALKVAKAGNGAVKLKAVKPSGKVTVTVQTAGGAKKTITVTLQKGKVKTKKITGVVKKLTLKKGKSSALKAVLSPISSTEKIKYTSSNKKVVKVDSKGRIKALKPGKATITIKSGKKKIKCTVTVIK